MKGDNKPGDAPQGAFPATVFNTSRQQSMARTKRAPFIGRAEQREPFQSSFAGASHSLHLPIVLTCLTGAPPDPNLTRQSQRDRSLQRGQVRKKECRSRAARSDGMSCTVRRRGEWRRPQLRWWRRSEGGDRCVLRPPW